MVIQPGYQLEIIGIEEDGSITSMMRAVLMDDGSLCLPPSPGSLLPPGYDDYTLVTTKDGIAYMFKTLYRLDRMSRVGVRILNERSEPVDPREYAAQLAAFQKVHFAPDA